MDIVGLIMICALVHVIRELQKETAAVSCMA
jgi:hypothetical protein